MATMDNEVFQAFVTHAAVVTLKMMLMGPVTSYFRFTRGSFSNEEDVARKSDDEKKKLLRSHPDVERAQRCHRNDLENIVPFFFIGLLYALSGPDLSSALIHFRVFTASRIFHSFAYILAFPQPSRGLSYMLGMLTTLSMAYNLLSKVFVP